MRRAHLPVFGVFAVFAVLVVLASACGRRSTADGASDAPVTTGVETAEPPTTAATTTTTTAVTAPPTTIGPTVSLAGVTPAVPGPGHVVNRVKSAVGKVALTFDDGFCEACIGTMVAALERTGAHVTFCPNGTYQHAYAPFVDRIKALIAKGQLSLCNHTWDHKKITKLSAAALADEINGNEQWIEATFGVSGRPFFRPPYGAHDAASDAVAGSLGYTTVITWSSTLSDSILQPPETILQQLQIGLVPGGIVLGHLNYPTTGQVFDQILAVLAQRGLTPVTMAELMASGPV
jgi:peptidoglycan/xylan/chitin deacetylase (PgdA/CDA1 family)